MHIHPHIHDLPRALTAPMTVTMKVPAAVIASIPLSKGEMREVKMLTVEPNHMLWWQERHLLPSHS